MLEHEELMRLLLNQTNGLLTKEDAVLNNNSSNEEASESISLATSEESTTKEVAMISTYNAEDFGGIPEPKCWQDVRDCLNAGIDKMLLFGLPGIGKTYAGMFFGDVSRGVERLICTEDMTTAHVGGCVMPVGNGNFEWVDGVMLRGWKRGSRVIIDEIDKAGSDVAAELLAFTDTFDSASFTVYTTGEVFKPQPGFSVVMTSNIEHPEELPAALRDRFSCAIQINAPHPSALMRFPENQRMLAATLVAGKPGQRVSLRQMMYFNQLLASPTGAFSVERAAALAFSEAMATQIVASLRVATLSEEVSL